MSRGTVNIRETGGGRASRRETFVLAIDRRLSVVSASTETGEIKAVDDSKKRGFVRRRMLQGAGGLIAAAALPSAPLTAAQSAGTPAPARAASADITGRLARYMVESRTRALPPNVLMECKHRILDTFGAMVSGARMRPGEMALRYVRSLGGVEESTVIASNFRTTAVNAALANGMFGHADETDDFEPVTKAHPGCSVVPSALAIGERSGGIGHGHDPRGRARLRSLLPLPDGARSRSCAWHAPERRGHQLDVRRRRRSGRHGEAQRRADARGVVLRRTAGLGPVELGARRGSRREGVRLFRHGRAQRRHRRHHGRKQGSRA